MGRPNRDRIWGFRRKDAGEEGEKGTKRVRGILEIKERWGKIVRDRGRMGRGRGEFLGRRDCKETGLGREVTGKGGGAGYEVLRR